MTRGFEGRRVTGCHPPRSVLENVVSNKGQLTLIGTLPIPIVCRKYLYLQ